jgi:hypothetical protein
MKSQLLAGEWFHEHYGVGFVEISIQTLLKREEETF